jgi:hypothetical protein
MGSRACPLIKLANSGTALRGTQHPLPTVELLDVRNLLNFMPLPCRPILATSLRGFSVSFKG